MPIDRPTREQLLQDFAQLKIFQRGEQRAIHKPLLVLFALGKMSSGADRLMDFAAIEAEFKDLLREFGPSSAPASRHYPFWHLATDADGGLWELEGPNEILNRPRGSTPNVTELRENHVRGGFSPAVFEALSNDAALRSNIARLILQAHFPESLHEDLIAETGADLTPEGVFDATLPSLKRRRDPSFRERVLRAYEHRCCVCGFDLRIGSKSAGLEAAHIQWFQAEGPDIEANGMALCSLHHKIFDLGVFTVDPRSLTFVFSQQVNMGEATRAKILGHHGAGMILPQSKTYYPDPRHLEWHGRWVFKNPGRDL